jgi:hypothetical protein
MEISARSYVQSITKSSDSLGDFGIRAMAHELGHFKGVQNFTRMGVQPQPI